MSFFVLFISVLFSYVFTMQTSVYIIWAQGRSDWILIPSVLHSGMHTHKCRNITLKEFSTVLSAIHINLVDYVDREIKQLYLEVRISLNVQPLQGVI